MPQLAFDLRDACRGLRRESGYTATVLLTLALTIGATTAVFSIVDGVVLKPLAFREAHRLVALREIWRQFAGRYPTLEVNEQHFEYWRQHARSFESLAQYIWLPANLTGAGEAAQITLVRGSGSLFDVLQVPAAIGRTLTPDDERSDRPLVAVITDALWRQRFNGDRSVIGRSIVLNGRPHTIVGVLPADLQLPERDQLSGKIDAFVAIRMAEEQVGWFGDHNNQAIGRLRRSVSPDEARAELDVLQSQVAAIATKEAHEPVTLGSSVTALGESIVGHARRGLLLLLAAIAAVLLIACSNLANLSVTRTIGRLRDLAIRSALGAGRGRLVGRVVLEQVALSIAGGALGVLVARGALAAFVTTAPLNLPRVNEVALDGRVLAFGASISIVTGLLVALLPAWHIAGRNVETALRVGSTSLTTDRLGLRTRAALLTLQVGLSVTLLVVAGLLSVSFVRLTHVDPGFNVDRVLTLPVSLPSNRYADDGVRRATYDRILAAIRALPAVETAAMTSMLPLTGQGQVNFIAPAGSTRPRSEQPTANFRMVAPDFFRTLGVPIRRGRPFRDNERDPLRPAPSVISQSVAVRLWPGEDPLGKRFSRQLPGEQGFEVIGVVGDAKTTSLESAPPLMVYVPYWWGYLRPSTALLVKTGVDPASITSLSRRSIQQIDPDIAVGESRTLEAIVGAALAGRRYQMQLVVVFGAVALMIAMVGVYAVTSYTVSRRNREMNLRVALGAQRSQVLALVVRQGLGPVAVGLAGGTGGAAVVGGIVSSLLFDVNARDPIVIAAVTAMVGAVASTACVIAARQGLGLDPVAALREEP
jgi:putative ABC transport system permease protein